MYTIESLVPFDMLVDIDMGLMKLIQKEYSDNNVFKKTILTERNMDIMKMILTERIYSNPVKFFVKDEFIQDADNLYDQFVSERYIDILKLSCNTGIFNIVRRSKSVDDSVKFSILCRNNIESSEIKNRFKKYEIIPKIVLSKNIEDVDSKKYGNIYIKDYTDILKYGDIEGKNIIIGNYRFNMEKGIPNVPIKDITMKLISLNAIKIIDIYPLSENKISVG